MASEQDVQKLMEGIRGSDENSRLQAVESAGNLGPEAVAPLGEAMADSNIGVSRAAKRALWQIVYTTGAPGGRGRVAVSDALVPLLGDNHPREVRREVLWMISELSNAKLAAQPVAQLLEDENLREDARMVLERLPGPEAVAALQAGFIRASESFKYHIAQSLKKRGVAVHGYPCQKLLPTRAKIPMPSGD